MGEVFRHFTEGEATLIVTVRTRYREWARCRGLLVEILLGLFQMEIGVNGGLDHGLAEHIAGPENSLLLLQLGSLCYQLGFKSGVWISYLVVRLFIH